MVELTRWPPIYHFVGRQVTLGKLKTNSLLTTRITGTNRIDFCNDLLKHTFEVSCIFWFLPGSGLKVDSF